MHWGFPAGLVAHQVEGLQLHGTGTSLGDPIEVGAAAGRWHGIHPGWNAVMGKPLVFSGRHPEMGWDAPLYHPTLPYQHPVQLSDH